MCKSSLVKDENGISSLSATVYTQTTDVEIETNGILTYNRKVEKMPAATLHKVHHQLYDVDVK